MDNSPTQPKLTIYQQINLRLPTVTAFLIPGGDWAYLKSLIRVSPTQALEYMEQIEMVRATK